VKALLHMFERVRRHFEEGGKLRAGKPVFDAAEHVFFAPTTRTSRAPHIRDPLDLKRFMSVVIVALVPTLLAALYFFGLRVLAMIAVSYVVGGTVEVLFAVVRKEEINEGFLVTGLLFPLILPPALPLWMVAVGVAFGVLVGKEVFGGTGRNIFNPALVGRCFLALAYPRTMSSEWVKPVAEFPGRLLEYVTASNLDAVTAATPLVTAKQGELVHWSNLLFGNVSGSAGETCALAIIIGGTFLLLTRVGSWRTVFGVLGSFILLAGVLHFAQPDEFAPVGWGVLAGGLLFGAFFMATDPVTSPVTNAGKWACGAIIGVIIVLIRNLTGYVEGVMFAILLGNIVAPILDEVVIGFRIRRLQSEG
jgi:Na(+)-translocating NADH:ubiquinone oxidoreductase B subunit